MRVKGSIREVSRLDFAERVSDPDIPSAGNMAIYNKNGVLYKRLPSGTISELGAGGGLTTVTLDNTDDGITAEDSKHYLCDTSTAAFTVNLPAGASGDIIRFSDTASNFGINALTVSPAAGEAIDGYAADEDLVVDLNGAWVQLMWDGSRWVLDSVLITDTGATVESSSSGRNFWGDNSGFENANVNDWTNATNITISSTATDPLVGDNSGLIETTASVAEGDYIKRAFSIPSQFQNEMLVVSFEGVDVSGYTSGFLEAYVYDVTNTAEITSSRVSIPAGKSRPFEVLFPAASDSTSYELKIECTADGDGNAFSYKVDDFVVDTPAGGISGDIFEDEFLFNTDTSNADDTTSFGYGEGGQTVPNISFTAARDKTIKSTKEIGPEDQVTLEVNSGGVSDNNWIPLTVENTGSVCLLRPQGSNLYGIGVIPDTTSSTQLKVRFGRYRLPGATYGIGGYSWAGQTKWRVRIRRKITGVRLAEHTDPQYISHNGTSVVYGRQMATIASAFGTGPYPKSLTLTPQRPIQPTDHTMLGFWQNGGIVDLRAKYPLQKLPVGEWNTFTPSWTNLSVTVHRIARWRRVGSSMEVQITAASVTTSGTVALTIPNGESIDSALTSTPGLGYMNFDQVVGTLNGGEIFTPFRLNATTLNFFCAGGNLGASGRTTASNTFHLNMLIPIEGWEVDSDPYGIDYDIDSQGRIVVTAGAKADADTEWSSLTDTWAAIVSGDSRMRGTEGTFSKVTTDEIKSLSGGAIPMPDAGIEVDTIAEKTAAAGVSVDGVTLKDGGAIFSGGGDSLNHYEESDVTSASSTTGDNGTFDYSLTRIGRVVILSYEYTASGSPSSGFAGLTIPSGFRPVYDIRNRGQVNNNANSNFQFERLSPAGDLVIGQVNPSFVLVNFSSGQVISGHLTYTV